MPVKGPTLWKPLSLPLPPLSLCRDMERAYDKLMQTEREAITARGHQAEVRAYSRTSRHHQSPTTSSPLCGDGEYVDDNCMYMYRFFFSPAESQTEEAGLDVGHLESTRHLCSTHGVHVPQTTHAQSNL